MKRLLMLSSLALAACASSPAAPPEEPVPLVDATPAEPSIVVTEAMGSPHLGNLAPDFELPIRTASR